MRGSRLSGFGRDRKSTSKVTSAVAQPRHPPRHQARPAGRYAARFPYNPRTKRPQETRSALTNRRKRPQIASQVPGYREDRPPKPGFSCYAARCPPNTRTKQPRKASISLTNRGKVPMLLAESWVIGNLVRRNLVMSEGELRVARG